MTTPSGGITTIYGRGQAAGLRRGCEEHGEDLAALDYSGELTQETYDLAIYALLYGLLRSSPDHPSVRGLVICARLALQHAKNLSG